MLDDYEYSFSDLDASESEISESEISESDASDLNIILDGLKRWGELKESEQEHVIDLMSDASKQDMKAIIRELIEHPHAGKIVYDLFIKLQEDYLSSEYSDSSDSSDSSDTEEITKDMVNKMSPFFKSFWKIYFDCACKDTPDNLKQIRRLEQMLHDLDPSDKAFFVAATVLLDQTENIVFFIEGLIMDLLTDLSMGYIIETKTNKDDATALASFKNKTLEVIYRGLRVLLNAYGDDSAERMQAVDLLVKNTLFNNKYKIQLLSLIDDSSYAELIKGSIKKEMRDPRFKNSGYDHSIQSALFSLKTRWASLSSFIKTYADVIFNRVIKADGDPINIYDLPKPIMLNILSMSKPDSGILQAEWDLGLENNVGFMPAASYILSNPEQYLPYDAKRQAFLAEEEEELQNCRPS